MSLSLVSPRLFAGIKISAEGLRLVPGILIVPVVLPPAGIFFELKLTLALWVEMLFPSLIEAVVLLGSFRSALPSFLRVTLSWTSDLPAFTPVSSSFGAGCPLLNAIIGSAERLLLSVGAMARLVGAFMAGRRGKPPSKPAVCIG